MKILVGVYPELAQEMGTAVVVTYPADKFPFCVAYVYRERDGTTYDFDDMPCTHWINSEDEFRAYAENHFGPGNWEIRDLSGEAW